MHEDEIAFPRDALARLIANHAPDWAGLPLTPVPSAGTDNRMYRMGTDLAVRVPRRLSAIALLEKEVRCLPRFRGLPLAVPVPLALIPALPAPVAVLRWIEGETATPERLGDPVAAAVALAGFLKALRRTPTADAPLAGEANHRRGVPLGALDAQVRADLAVLADEVDEPRALALWEAACAAPPPPAPLWLHGDIRADNLLARHGRLSGVLDFGLAAVGDPAADTAAAWTWVAPEARDGFRDALGPDAAEWARGKGWALYGAGIALAWYRGGRNAALSAACRATFRALGL